MMAESPESNLTAICEIDEDGSSSLCRSTMHRQHTADIAGVPMLMSRTALHDS
jgi:hypothetical protein